jgi:hypothetical protein
MQQSCPGGAHGQDPLHYPDVVTIEKAVGVELEKVKGSLK